MERIAVLFLTPHCNMTCRFCITTDGLQTLLPDQVCALLKGLREAGVGNVIFGGGEPLAWPHDILASADFAKGLGLTVQVGTNGIALDSGHMRSAAIDRFILPLEAADPGIHDSLRHAGAGHHSLVLSRLKALASLGKTVTLSTVITRINRGGLLDLAGWIRRYAQEGGDLHAWHLYRFLPQGRGGGANAGDLDLSKEEYHAAADGIKAAFPDLPILKRPDMTHSATVGFFWRENGRIRYLCPYPVTPLDVARGIARGAGIS